MIQEILTYIIVAAAFIYTFYGILKIFLKDKKNVKHSCSGSCSSCSFKKNFLEEIQIKN